MKKYKLTDEYKKEFKYEGNRKIDFKLFRIEALISFNDVKKGDIGGWLESELNLSQDGLCWVYDDSIVSERAIVSDNARVLGDSTVNGFSKIYGNAIINRSNIGDTSVIFGNAEVTESSINGESIVFDNAKINSSHITGDDRYTGSYTNQKLQIYGNSQLFWVRIDGVPHIFESATIDKGVSISHSPRIYGRSVLRGQTKPDPYFSTEATLFINDDVEIFGNAVVEAQKKEIKENALFIKNSSRIYGNAHIFGSGSISGHAHIYDYAKVDGLFDLDDNCKIFGESNLSGKFKIWILDNVRISGKTFILANKKSITLGGIKNIKNKMITRNLFFGLF